MLNVAVATESRAGQLPDGGERTMNTRGHAMPIDELLENRFTPVALRLCLEDGTDGKPRPVTVLSSPPD